MQLNSAGVFFNNAANRATATFVINNAQYTFTGIFTPSVGPFTSRDCNLTYIQEADLKSVHSFNGVIGTNDFSLTLNNGQTIIGILNDPGVIPPVNVMGSGSWEKI